MNYKRAIGIFLLAAGIVGIFLANYIADRVSSESTAAQAKIAKGKKMFEGNPFSEMVGGAVANSAQGKVDKEVAKYEQIVLQVRLGGIFFAVVGLGMTIFCSNKKKSRY